MLKKIDLRKRSVDEIKDILKERSQKDLSEYRKVARDIIEDIKKRKDKALFAYTARFDKIELDASTVKVTQAEIESAVQEVDNKFLNALKKAAQNIEEFHEHQKESSWQKQTSPGKITGQICRPLAKAGIYVPGGRAAYPSSVLMTALPAKVAGVEEVVMVTPPGKEGKLNPKILAAAQVAGVDSIYKVGGAQAVAALAYGTESIPKVDIVVGPGNIYVTMAKELVFGQVKIDMTAGPSEVLVLADGQAEPAYIAADLMSQAEHDPLASSILVTNSADLGPKVEKEIKKQIEDLEKKDIIKESLSNYGLLIEVEDMESGIEAINQIAPEHLELAVEKPFDLLPEIKNAGSIFLGEYTPEPIGDYYAGPNHVLPTEGTARFFSPLAVRDFVKYSSFIYYSREALKEASDDVITLAEGEGLTAHANSIKIRKESIEDDVNGN
ncbi:MAG TPA: histidinol dehydrogenase [Halanaerobiales bacterium]|nr:histidinol dehydrogenase [Halanaerobiales bacterium]